MSRTSNANRLIAVGEGLMKLFSIPGRWAAWLVIMIIAVVIFTVIGSALGLSHLAGWGLRLPLFGNQLNMVGIAELQWHLFALLIMISGSYVLQQDRHIRVDIVSTRMSPKGRVLVDLLGDLIFLIPFYAFLLWFSFGFSERAFLFGEQSNSGGLIDRYLVKATLPLGCLLLLGAGCGRILRNLGMLMETKNIDHNEDNVRGEAE